jgi:hypothetical protein
LCFFSEAAIEAGGRDALDAIAEIQAEEMEGQY